QHPMKDPHITTIYARKGHPQELPCGLDKALLGAEELIWSYNGGGNQQSKMLFRVMADRPPKRQPDAWDNLSVLRNHSLYLRVAEDSDTGTYWCTAPGANQHYYELAVVTGGSFSHSRGRGSQHSPEVSDSPWLRVFWGPQTALLQACWERKEIGDPHAQARKGQVWCELKDTRVTFKPTGRSRGLGLRTPGFFPGSGRGGESSGYIRGVGSWAIFVTDPFLFPLGDGPSGGAPDPPCGANCLQLHLDPPGCGRGPGVLHHHHLGGSAVEAEVAGPGVSAEGGKQGLGVRAEGTGS
uniref:Ig-like domain-containing protein n=1 Tax=Pelusios castaneus TaxID=367368 RepID=A0A8C8RMQ6_9SAUR